MGFSVVLLIVFAGISLICLSAYLVLRDLFAPAGGGVLPGQSLLRRPPDVFQQPKATKLSGRIDQSFERLILQCGLDLTPNVVFLMLVAGSLAVGGSLWIYSGNFLLGTIGGLAGLLAPIAYFALQRARRMMLIQDQMPHLLDMLSRAVHAGESVDQALELVGTEGDACIRREFLQCHRQLEMGRNFEAVMTGLSSRIPLMDMKLLTTTLVVQRRTGGALADSLERLSAVVRDRLTAARQMRASTGAGRASTLLIATVSPLAYVVVYFLMPEHIATFSEHAVGPGLLALAVGLELLGLLWVFSLLRQT